MKPLELWGSRLIVLSAFLFAVAIPTSMALDNIAAAVGILGAILLLLTSSFKPFPPIKPFLFFLVPEVARYLIFSPVKIFKKTDFDHHLISYFVSFRVAKDKEVFNKVVTLLMVSTLALCFSVVFEAFTHQNIKHIDWSTLSFHTEILRARGFLDHPLTTGGVLYLLIVLFAILYFREKKKSLLLPLPFLLFSLLLSESRSYWLAFVTFVVLLSLLSFRENKRLTLISLGGLFLAGALIFQVPALKERFYSIPDTKSYGSNIIRLMIWKSHFKAFSKDYTLFEKLFGTADRAGSLAWKHFGEAYEEVTGKKPPPPEELKKFFYEGLTHNLYLKFLTKYGIVGLIGYLIFWGYVFAFNLLKLKSVKEPLLVKAFLAGYTGFLIASFFENNFTDAEVQFTLFFILGLNFALLEET
ncbi:O-antigen ligase family protein [Phorcysia thermohydrogeniphila]|uniref:O-antigen ligase n=1 Tax=Phorcysia thermohydrogeniphila TaxID=936138 RepID=A0A4R1GHJ9_9BACT|nr:O-antigen ligase family protein [Phorcysia thermohydrogeniphila]TCK06531.1 O-antigen ligase [Phorcysia thermohydrogeniphila]